MVVADVGEPGTDGDVGVLQTCQDRVDVGRVVLAVGIDLDHGVVAMPLGVDEPGPHGATDAEVERQVEHGGASRSGHVGGGVRGAVVDDDHGVVDGGEYLGHRRGDVLLLVPGRHDHQHARGFVGVRALNLRPAFLVCPTQVQRPAQPLDHALQGDNAIRLVPL